MNLKDVFSTKVALVIHIIFFSLALLQGQFELGLLWFLINVIVLILLLRVKYSETELNRLRCWYLYVLSICTDVISIATFGPGLSKGNGYGNKSTQTFALVMAIFVLIPKPIFAFFMFLFMKDEGVNFRQVTPKHIQPPVIWKDLICRCPVANCYSAESYWSHPGGGNYCVYSTERPGDGRRVEVSNNGQLRCYSCKGERPIREWVFHCPNHGNTYATPQKQFLF